MSIVAVSAAFPGVSRVLEEGEKLRVWDFVRIDQDGTVKMNKADIYLLGAWHPGYEELVSFLHRDFREVKVGVLWTSSCGEMGLEPIEQEFLERILADDRIDFIWFGDPALADIFEKGFHIPYPLKYEEHQEEKKERSISLFAPRTAKKNLFTQFAAAKLAQDKYGLILHTNVTLPFECGVNAVKYPWLPRNELQRVVSSSLLHMGVSFAETFSYATADAALWGTPSVVSPAVSWAPAAYSVSNPNDASEILEAVECVLESPRNATEAFRQSLMLHATTDGELLTEFLHSRIMSA